MVFLLVGKGKPGPGVDRIWPPDTTTPRGGLDKLDHPMTGSTTRCPPSSRQARPSSAVSSGSTTRSPHVGRVGRSADERVGLARVWRASEERASGCPRPLVRAESGGSAVVSTGSTTPVVSTGSTTRGRARPPEDGLDHPGTTDSRAPVPRRGRRRRGALLHRSSGALGPAHGRTYLSGPGESRELRAGRTRSPAAPSGWWPGRPRAGRRWLRP